MFELTLTLEAIIALLLAEILLELKPGPSMLAYTSMAVAGRWRAMLSFWLGGFVAGSIMYGLFLGGLTLIPENFGMVFIFIKSAAALLFITIGIKGLQSSIAETKNAGKAQAEEISQQSPFANFMAGFLMVLSNPYLIVFILTVVPAVVQMISFTVTDIIVIRMLMMIGNVFMLSLFCIPLIMLRRAFSDKILRYMQLFSSVAMILIGIVLFASMLLREDLKEAGLLSHEAKHIVISQAS